MDKKGQALVEFIIIIPFIVMLIVTLFDFSKIIETKIELENELDNYTLNNDYPLTGKLTFNKDTDTITYILSKNVELSSIYLTPILGTNYDVSIKRTLYDK